MGDRLLAVPASELLEYALGGFQGPDGSLLDAAFERSFEALFKDEETTNAIFVQWRNSGPNAAVEQLSIRICMLLNLFYRENLCDSAMFDFIDPNMPEDGVSVIKAYGFFNPCDAYAEHPGFVFRMPTYSELADEVEDLDEYYHVCNTLLLACLLAHKRYYHLLTEKIHKYKKQDFGWRFVELYESFESFPQTVALGDWGDSITRYWAGQFSTLVNEKRFVEEYGTEKDSASKAFEATNLYEDKQGRHISDVMRENLWLQMDGLVNMELRDSTWEDELVLKSLPPQPRRGLIKTLFGFK